MKTNNAETKRQNAVIVKALRSALARTEAALAEMQTAETDDMVRAESIALTPSGEAVSANDAARLAELRAEDQRTPGEIADDAAAMAEIEAA